MMKKSKVYSLIAIVAVMVALIVFGSFWDYEIAEALYLGQLPSENIFGIIFAFIGIIPTFVGWSFLGAGILCLAKRTKLAKVHRRLLIALCVLLFVLSFFYFCNTLLMVNANAFSVHWAVAYSIGILTLAGAAHLGYKLSEKSTNPELLKKLLILTAVSLLTLIIISSTKSIMDRPRFRFVLESGNPDYFRNWWQSGSALKESLGTGAISDEFSSFPSGHSAYSAFAIFIFPALADFTEGLKKFRAPLFALGFVWWGSTAFSRLSIGAHYLSDVATAGLIPIAAYVVVSALAKNFISRKNKL